MFRINLDLNVQKEVLKREVDDKKVLLQRAFDAIESLEAEQLRERKEYQAQIESLRQSNQESHLAFKQRNVSV